MRVSILLLSAEKTKNHAGRHGKKAQYAPICGLPPQALFRRQLIMAASPQEFLTDRTALFYPIGAKCQALIFDRSFSLTWEISG
jgi:hypothetical protein